MPLSRAEIVARLPGVAGTRRRGFFSALQCGDTHSPEPPGVITYSFPRKPCPSSCRLCTLFWGTCPHLLSTRDKGGSASADKARGAFRICVNGANMTNATREWARGANNADLLSVSPLPGWWCTGPPPRPPWQVGRCVALLHAIMTFWVMYTFSLSHSLSPSFFMRTGTRLMTEPQKKRNAMPL